MTADQIKAALRAAARDMNGRMADRGYEVPWPEDAATIAAAAVAAFLRALPTGSGKGLFEYGDDDSPQCLFLSEAVAAVEKAARDE